MSRTLLPKLALGLLCIVAQNASGQLTQQPISVRSDSPGLAGSTQSNIEAEPMRSKTIDLVVEGKSVEGRLVSRAGQLAGNRALRLMNSKGKALLTKTDAKGAFKFAMSEPGIYALQAEGTRSQFVRVWDKRIAPPTAKQKLLVVLDGAVIRGQCCDNPSGVACDGCGDCGDCCGGTCGGVPQFGVGRLVQGALDNPWLVAAGTAAAIAIPLATDDDDERNGDDTDAVGGGSDEDAS